MSDNAEAVAAAVAAGAIPNAEYAATVLAKTPTEAVVQTPEAAAAVARPDHIPEKFWDAATGKVRQDELLKSYTELETRLRQGKPAEAEKVAEPAADATKVTLERKADETPEAKAATDNPVAKALETAGLSFDAVNAEYQATGDVKPETRTALEAAFGKQVVDTYFDGLKALEASTVLSAHEAAGGKEVFDKAAAWGIAQLSDAELESYNKLVGDPTTQKQGVEWLVSKYSAANPSEGTFVSAEVQPGHGDVFNSNQEMTTAMRDPQYARDPAFRQKVAEKLQRSVKAGTLASNVTTHSQTL